MMIRAPDRAQFIFDTFDDECWTTDCRSAMRAMCAAVVSQGRDIEAVCRAATILIAEGGFPACAGYALVGQLVSYDVWLKEKS